MKSTAFLVLISLVACVTPPREEFFQDYLTLGNGYYDLKKWPEAERYYRRAMEIQPLVPAVAFNLARVLIEAGKLDDAVKLLQEIKTRDPENLLVRKSLAYVLFWKGQERNALAEYTSISEEMPGDLDTLYNLGLVASKLEETQLSRTALEKWLELNGTATVPKDVWIALETVYRKLEDAAGLKKVLESLVMSDPGNPARALELAGIWEKEGNWTQMVAKLIQADQILTIVTKTDAELRWKIGEIYLLQLSQPDTSLEWFGKAIEAKFANRTKAEELLARPEILNPEPIKLFFEEKGLLGGRAP